MSTLKSLQTDWKKLTKTKVKDLETAIEYLQDRAGLYHNELLYMTRNNVSDKGGSLSDATGAYKFRSVEEIKEDKAFDLSLIKKLEIIERDHGNVAGFKKEDLTDYAVNTRSPSKAIKLGGSYNPDGYPTYIGFFLPQNGNKYMYVVPKGDDKGFFFMFGTDKVYFFKFMQSSDEEEEPTPSPPSKKKKKKQKHSESEPEPSSSKVLLPKKGHGLERLLAEAKDPPILELRHDSTDYLRGLKRRWLKDPDVLNISTVYHWSETGPRCMLVEVTSEEARKRLKKRYQKGRGATRTGNFDQSQNGTGGPSTHGMG